MWSGSRHGLEEDEGHCCFFDKETAVPTNAKLRESVLGLMPQVKEKAKMLRTFGTSGPVQAAEKLGDLPIKNWKLGSWQEEAQKLSGQTMAETILSGRYSCSNCPIGCGRVVLVPDLPYGGSPGGARSMKRWLPSVPCASSAIYAPWPERMNSATATESTPSQREISSPLPWKPTNNDILNKKDLDGIDLVWGSPGAMLELLRKVGEREGIGELLSEGIRISAERIGKGSEAFAMHVKGLEFAMHDPRAYSSLAVSYATSRIGASHWAPTHLLEARQPFPDIGYPEIVDRFEVERQRDHGGKNAGPHGDVRGPEDM